MLLSRLPRLDPCEKGSTPSPLSMASTWATPWNMAVSERFFQPTEKPKPYMISGTLPQPMGTLSYSSILPSPFMSLYLMSPGRVSPVCTGDAAISP